MPKHPPDAQPVSYVVEVFVWSKARSAEFTSLDDALAFASRQAQDTTARVEVLDVDAEGNARYREWE